MDPDLTSRECKGHLRPITAPIKPLPCLLGIPLLILPCPHLLLGPSHLHIMPNQLLIHFTLCSAIASVECTSSGVEAPIQLSSRSFSSTTCSTTTITSAPPRQPQMPAQRNLNPNNRQAQHIVGNHLLNHNPIHIHLKYTPPLNYPYHHFKTRTLEQLKPFTMLRHNISKQLLLSSMIFTIAQEEYCKKVIILTALKDHIKQKKIQKRRSKDHGLHLIKRRQQNQRLRELPHGYHQILHVFKRKIRKKGKMRRSWQKMT